MQQFIANTEIVELENWAFEAHLWRGEAFGFSEWLCLDSEPDVARSIAIDFAEFPACAAKKVLAIIGLSLFQGMQYHEIETILGEPIETYTFNKDRTSYEFKTLGDEPYLVSCTILNEDGLSYIVIRTPLPDKNETA